MLIRQATTSDIADVARVHVAAWDAAKDGLDLTTRRTFEDREDLWARFLAEGRGALWLAEAEDGVVGFCAIGPSRDEDRAGESEIYTLYVEPHRWGRGIGSALMSRAPINEVVSLWPSPVPVTPARPWGQSRRSDPTGPSLRIQSATPLHVHVMGGA